jgi:hypothetical protein
LPSILVARGSLVRNADFSRLKLSEAPFTLLSAWRLKPAFL